MSAEFYCEFRQRNGCSDTGRTFGGDFKIVCFSQGYFISFMKIIVDLSGKFLCRVISDGSRKINSFSFVGTSQCRKNQFCIWFDLIFRNTYCNNRWFRFHFFPLDWLRRMNWNVQFGLVTKVITFLSFRKSKVSIAANGKNHSACHRSAFWVIVWRTAWFGRGFARNAKKKYFPGFPMTLYAG